MLLITRIEKYLNRAILFIGFIVILAWVFEVPQITHLIPGGASMKFNTALLFVIASFSITLSRKKTQVRKRLHLFFISILLFVSCYSILEYAFPVLPDLDNLLIEDKLSKDNFLGRMSIATAGCFMLFGIGNLLALRKKYERFAHYLYIAILYVSVISAIAYILAVPLDNRPMYFKTMAIHTSILFILLAYISLVCLTSSRFLIFIYGKYSGSRMLRTAIPLVIGLPIIFNYLLINVIANDVDSSDFTVVASTVVFISIGIIYLSLTAKLLNDADRKRKRLEKLDRMRQKHKIQLNLLDETHHRVKNNFQLVSSMLQLQAYTVKNESLVNILMDCKDRITTMAKLHENMYKFRGFETVEIESYLESIIDSIEKSFEKIKQVEFRLYTEPKLLDSKIAVPMGLIINEILTNSMKYAFPENQKGKIELRLTYEDDQNVNLIVKDNGVGFNKEVAIEGNSDSIGSKLINIFSQQLEGEVTLTSSPEKGTTYQIQFPITNIGSVENYAQSA
ncbi:MAG: sensor histidine kinase [Vicingaceae bacterium]